MTSQTNYEMTSEIVVCYVDEFLHSHMKSESWFEVIVIRVCLCVVGENFHRAVLTIFKHHVLPSSNSSSTWGPTTAEANAQQSLFFL